MSATAPPDRAGASVTLELLPLPAEALPPAVGKLLAGPAAMKQMAAKGIAPLKPGDLAIAVYQLALDPDASLRSAAEAAPAVLPDKIVVPALAEPLPSPVLHFFARKLAPGRAEAFEKILYNQGTADATFVLLAGRLGERELEIVFQNEARYLRCPAILEALYLNPQARMSSLNRAIELCVRNGVRVEGIPAFDDVARSIAEDASATAPEADQSFAGVLAASEGAPPQAAEAGEGSAAVVNAVGNAAAPTTVSPPADAPAQAGTAPSDKPTEKQGDRNDKRVGIPLVIDFTKLKLHEKIRLATLGNEYCRSNLIRDPNRVVAMAAIRSPKITDSEIVRAAGSRTVCEDVIRYIANQRDLLKHYQVKLNLVMNPKCPLAFSLRLMSLLNTEDIRDLSRSKNVPSALSTAARRLLQTRGGGSGR